VGEEVVENASSVQERLKALVESSPRRSHDLAGFMAIHRRNAEFVAEVTKLRSEANIFALQHQQDLADLSERDVDPSQDDNGATPRERVEIRYAKLQTAIEERSRKAADLVTEVERIDQQVLAVTKKRMDDWSQEVERLLRNADPT
jgi:hypothetical protein